MALAMLFAPSAMSVAKYDECIRRLEAAGAGHPPGRTSHVCYVVGDTVRVFDVWESKEQFEQFGATLMPILHALGVDAGDPEVARVHNTIDG